MDNLIIKAVLGTLALAASLWLLNIALRLISAPNDSQVLSSLVLLGGIGGTVAFALTRVFPRLKWK